MNAQSNETIVAIATAPQNGAIGIIRLSGPDCVRLTQRFFVQPDGAPYSVFQPRYFHFGKILDGDGRALDEALCVSMPGPRSFTGEDVVELHCHGNLVLLKTILARIFACALDLPVRPAEPGEFTKRAFLNGRMDLTQAEAVHEIITAGSEAALKSSLSNLDGALKRHVSDLKERLTTTLALVEASFEFPEEDIQTFDRAAVLQLLGQIRDELAALVSAHATSKLYDAGITVAIVGRPNVGKSSLLNAILVEERAIVTPVAGTTRDVVEGSKVVGGVRFVFRDTAGLRASADAVEQMGVLRSQEAIRQADVVLWVSDDPHESLPDLLTAQPLGRVYCLLSKADVFSAAALSQGVAGHFDLSVSAKTRQGIDVLEKTLLDFVTTQTGVQNFLHINARQHQALQGVLQNVVHILDSADVRDFNEEILAEELRLAIGGLKEVTGEISSDAVLGEIFRRFCIGK